MPKIKLTNFETEVLLDLLDERHLCRIGCYCNYPKPRCNKLDNNGNYKCQLQKAIHNISKQINSKE